MCQMIYISIILVLAVIAPACTQNSFTYPPAPEASKPGALVLNSSRFKTSGGSYRADVGTVVVPENRNRPGSRMIYLPVIRIRSSNVRPSDPIFAMTGGPGMSNMKWEPLDSLLAEHDFIMVGYRGVDGSVVLDAPEVVEALKESKDFLEEKTLRAIGKAWNASADRLRASGVDLDGYTILEVIEDMEAVREAMDYQHINLLSESYGTRVAYLYGLRHPDRIVRSAMIGVNPPGRFVWEATMVDNQLQNYSDLWAKDSTLRKRSADLFASMKKLSGTMPKKWLFFPIDQGKVKVMTFALLFNRTTASMAIDAWVEAGNGDPSGLALMSMASDLVLPSMFVWGDLASKAVSADLDSTRDYLAELDPPGTVMGSPLSRLLWGPLSLGTWPIAKLPEEFRRPRDSQVRTLLLSGTVDFSTPVEYASHELVPHLPHVQHVILRDLGHVTDVWNINPEATSLMLTSFYRTGVADTSLNKNMPMEFVPSWSFTTIAKVGLGVIAVVTTAAIIGMVWVGSKVIGT